MKVQPAYRNRELSTGLNNNDEKIPTYNAGQKSLDVDLEYDG